LFTVSRVFRWTLQQGPETELTPESIMIRESYLRSRLPRYIVGRARKEHLFTDGLELHGSSSSSSSRGRGAGCLSVSRHRTRRWFINQRLERTALRRRENGSGR